ncbi:MAG: UbiX family flavin prenyltransferase [Planctomycetes bacterium]|nr:UbiX family flavin prenyltransferase [Planctomycetota bacterium]
MKRIVLAMTGASGAALGLCMLKVLARREDLETHLILSEAARETLKLECGLSPEDLTDGPQHCWDNRDLTAPPASGSWRHEGMLVVPCSIKTLSAVANSFAEGLIARAADVSLKEGRPLLLCVRETPLHAGHLELMQKAARLGAILFPPVPAFYSRPTSLDEMILHLVGRMLARIGLANDLYPQWGET